jgi:hypothetical protein
MINNKHSIINILAKQFIFFLTCTLFYSSNVNGQPLNDYFSAAPKGGNPAEPLNEINIYSSYFANSNIITNSFIHTVINNGYINDGLKNEVISRIKQTGRFGYKLKYGAGYNTNTLIKGFRLYGNLCITDHLFTNLNKNALKLAFNGNKQFEGQTVQLAPLGYTYLSYEKLTLGAAKTISSLPLEISGGIALLKGSDYHNIQIKQGALYTGSDGDIITLDAKAGAYFTNGGRTLTNWHGTGTSIHFGADYRFGSNGNISLHVNDIGAIWWNNMNSYSIDTNYSFDGRKIDNVLTGIDGAPVNFNSDSLKNMPGISSKIKNHRSVLPATVSLYYNHQLNKKISLSAGCHYIFNEAYIPKVYVSATYQLPYIINVTPVVTYGGYSSTDYGLGISKTFNKKILIGCYAFMIESLAFPKISTGQGLYFFSRINL